MKWMLMVAPVATLLAACGGNSGGSGTESQIKVVGSSTVYPFTKAAAEEFRRANPGTSVIVESTGTGAGMKLFCAGVGSTHPDLVNASRRIKPGELEDCNRNGVKQVVELPVGIDGLTFIQAAGTQPLNLTERDIYAALAANPFGKPNTSKTWKDVNASLPAIPIRVLGPPPTSGTRDSLVELYLEKGCTTDSAMNTLKDADEAKYKDICTKVREDGAFVEAGENDNLLVQKVSADPGTIGILGYSFLAENVDKIRPVQINGVAPNETTITDLSYPGARKLYVYVKGEHVQAKPAIRNFLETYARMMVKGGPLERHGLVPFRGDEGAAAGRQATDLKAMDASELK